MRIITGQLKSRRLSSFSSKDIRPMTDRVKTAVFDTLNSYCSFSNQRVLDLFSGTGNLAFEALSRGAKEVVMVDSGTKFLSIVNKNIELLKIKAGYKIYHQDVFYFLSTYGKYSNGNKPFDLIFADPPFTKHLSSKILSCLNQSKAVSNDTLLVLEVSAQEKVFSPRLSSCKLKLTKDFKDKKVLFYQWQELK